MARSAETGPRRRTRVAAGRADAPSHLPPHDPQGLTLECVAIVAPAAFAAAALAPAAIGLWVEPRSQVDDFGGHGEWGLWRRSTSPIVARLGQPTLRRTHADSRHSRERHPPRRPLLDVKRLAEDPTSILWRIANVQHLDDRSLLKRIPSFSCYDT